MATRHVLERLLRLRELEEEQSLLKLEIAVKNRNRAAAELELADVGYRDSRREFAAGIEERDALSRTAAVLPMEQARGQRMRIELRLAAADAEAVRQRNEFLIRRTGRRQVEMLVQQEQAAQQQATSRKAQQMLDDWYGWRTARETAQTANPESQTCHPFFRDIEEK